MKILGAIGVYRRDGDTETDTSQGRPSHVTAMISNLTEEDHEQSRSHIKPPAASTGEAVVSAPASTPEPAPKLPKAEYSPQPEAAAPQQAQQAQPVQYEQQADAQEEHVSTRLGLAQSIGRLSEDVDRQLSDLTERIEMARRTWSVLGTYSEDVSSEARKADAIEADRNTLVRELTKLKRSNDRLTKDLALKAGELDAAMDRVVALQLDLENTRNAASEHQETADRLAMELSRANSALTQVRAEAALINEQLEREMGEKQNAERARQELAAKLSRLQQAESLARNKAIEVGLQNEKLMEELPKLVSEQENLHTQLTNASRERGILQTRIVAAQDRIAQMEREIEELQSQAASAGYAAKTELEVAQAAQRTAERAQVETEGRYRDLQAQIKEGEAWRRAAEAEIVKLRREVEVAKKENVSALGRLSEHNLKYMTDLLSLEQQREENRQLMRNIEYLAAENQRLVKYESLYHAAESVDTARRESESGSEVADVVAEPEPARQEQRYAQPAGRERQAEPVSREPLEEPESDDRFGDLEIESETDLSLEFTPANDEAPQTRNKERAPG